MNKRISIYRPYRAVKRLAFSLSLAASLPFSSAVQAQADTDIFLVDLTLNPLQLGKPLNITQRKGYDNQPSFTPQGTSLLYTSLRDNGQTDIYRYDLLSQLTTPVTHTPESEYSPTVTPDRMHFSVIRVEADKTQRLWQFPLSGSAAPTLVLPQVRPVGYHCWLTADYLALFILGQPASLQLVHVGQADTVRIQQPIGRTLLKVPAQNALSYVHKATPTQWTINQLDLKTRQVSVIVPTLEGSEDFAWTPDGTLLMGRGAVLYRYRPGTDSTWVPLADFSALGITQLTRLAIDRQSKKLAFVGQ